MAGCVTAQGVGGFDFYGITHVSWWFDEYGSAAATASRDDLAAANANWAGVLVTWDQPTIASSTIAANSSNTPTDDGVRKAIREVRGRGMKVRLKPHAASRRRKVLRCCVSASNCRLSVATRIGLAGMQLLIRYVHLQRNVDLRGERNFGW